MPNPKYKTPRSKTRKRRSHLRLEIPNVTECPHCKQPKLPHHICRHCEQYDGKHYELSREFKIEQK